MVLRIIFAVCFMFFGISRELNAQDADLHDFSYRAELIIDTEKSLLGRISELFTGSDIEEDILSLRTFSEQNKTISNMRALSDRIKNDIEEIHKKAHNLGFYGAEVRYKTHVESGNRVTVTVFADFGDIFTLKLDVKYVGKDENFHKKYLERLNEEASNLTSSITDIKQIIDEAVRDLQRNGYYEPSIVEKKIWLNYKDKEAVLTLVIDPQKRVKFATTKINAFPDINREFIENRIVWSQGEWFDIEKVEQTSDNLYAGQIFSKVKITPEKTEENSDNIPMSISVKEDKKHTIDVSLLYSGMRSMNYRKKSNTSKSLKSVIGRISWTNYNTFGGAEKLRFTIEGTPMRAREHRSDYAFEVSLTTPDTFTKNNTSECIISRRQELTNVFFKKSDRVSVIFKYPLWFFSSIQTGGIFERNYVDSCEDFSESYDYLNKRYENIIIPIEFVVDKTDDMLDPTQGYRFLASYSYIKLNKANISTLHYLTQEFSYNLPLDYLRKTIVAFNIEHRRLLGNHIDDIPLDKRVYAGGMASVRGYANQLATDAIIGYDTVMGGKSSIEFNTELRRKFTRDFGGVLFMDGAKVFQNKSRHFETEKKRWFCSVGLGIRYFTSIGPIRADIAFPIRRRKGIDSKMQFILSLGQAF